MVKVNENENYINKSQTSLQNGDYQPPKDESIPDILLSDKNEMYIVNDDKVNIYSPVGGNLLEVLKGHEHKIVNICKTKIFNEEAFVSCDIKGTLFYWYTNKEHYMHNSSSSINFHKDSTVTHFSATKNLFILSFKSRDSDASTLCSISKLQINKAKFKIKPFIVPGQNKVTSSNEFPMVAAITLDSLFVADISELKEKKIKSRNHHLGNFSLNCIQFHPTDKILATGNKNGSIFLFYDIMEKYPTKVTLHWHTMPVRDICFSATGSDLFSGGDECVFVRWQITQNNKKSFLPRMGLPIQRIQTDRINSFVATMHSDFSISIVNSKEMKLEGLIQTLPLHIPVTSESVLSIGLHYHTPSQSLMKNGRTGYILFFNAQLMKVDYNLDISLANFVTEERNKKLPNFEVTKAAITDDGSWLVTCESCQLTPNMKEVIMKFWNFSSSDQRWELNTIIEMPHSGDVNSLSLIINKDGEHLCVSCSEEGKFKLWKLITYVDVLGKTKRHWNAQASREFRNLAATSSCFAPDSSLFAVGFENIVTLWSPENVTMKGVLAQPFLRERIIDITFSYGDLAGSALVTRSNEYLCSWNLLSCSLLWRVFVKSTCLTVDPTNGLMALFTKERDVHFFEPRFQDPIVSKGNVSLSEVVCGVFAPYYESSGEQKCRKSSNQRRIYYFDLKQKFYSLEPPDILGEDSEREEEDLSLTNLEIRPQRNSEKTQQYSAIVAKSKKIDSHDAPEKDVDVSLASPSLNNLIKEIQELRVHSMSVFGLAEHMSTFLPDLKPRDNSTNQSNRPEYTTIKDDDRSISLTSKSQFNLDKESNLASLQKFNYTNLLDKLYS